MSEERKTRYHGRGIASRWSKRDNAWHYTISYRWTPPTDELARLVNGTKGKPKKIVETVPADKKGRFLEGTAIKLKANRDRFHNADGWVPPHIKAAADAEHDETETERREPLLYEVARTKYMETDAKDYADGGKAARTAFNRLGLFFDGRMLDEVTRLDIREYYTQRATGTMAYSKYKPTIRAAEMDESYLRALYTHLIEQGHKIESPCHRPRSRKKDSPLAPYRVQHRKITPEPDTLDAIFTATKQADLRPGESVGREIIRDEHRALWMLCYFTAARPESEPCRLRHRDVRFLADGWATVNYGNTKNESSKRTLPIPPEAAEALRGIMLDKPAPSVDGAVRLDDRAAWGGTRVFRKRGSRAPWVESSYNKIWADVVSVVPGIEGMWCRDLRSTAKKWMRKAKIDRPVVMAVMGHKPDVHDEYDNVDMADLRAAAEALRLDNVRRVIRDEAAEKLADKLAASHDAHGVT